MRPARPWVLLLACAAWPLAHAQAIYRCGDSYSQQPCAGGTQLAPAAPGPSAADRSQAAAAAARDARLADALEKDRVRREAQAGKTAVVLPTAPVAEPEPHQWPDKAATRKLDLFTASVPGSGRSKAKTAAKAKSGPKDAAKANGAGVKVTSAGKAGQQRAVQPAPTRTAKAAGGG
jgi:hypothetical protein